jgi:hypothetical protein
MTITGDSAACRIPTMTARRGLRYEMAAVLGERSSSTSSRVYERDGLQRRCG